MGMDVYGRNPTNETGEYFQRNVWGWRPLAVAVQRIAPDICAKCKYWQSNDSDGLEADDAKALASAIRNHIDSRHLDHTMFAAKDLVEPARCHQEQCLAGPFLEAGFRMNPTTDYADITVADLLEFAEFLEASGGFSIVEQQRAASGSTARIRGETPMTIYLKKRKGPPVLLCDPDGDVKGVPQWKAWCPFCATYHRHGAEQGTASRRCHTDSPFNDGGYVSRLRRNAEVADARRKRKAQRW